MNFFNIISIEELESIPNEAEIHDLLIKKGALSMATEIDMDKNQLVKKSIPTSLLKLDFFNFIEKHYRAFISKGIFDFFIPFENKSFGKKESAYDLALEDFNEIYKDLKLESVVLTKVEKTSNGIDHHNSIGRMRMVKYSLDAVKNNFSLDDEILIEYLLGNEAFFDVELTQSNEVLNKAFKRYIKLKILIELNDRFGFEKSKDFGRAGYINELHEQFRDITEDSELFHYVYNTIDNLKTNKKANISSLFCALRRSKKIDTKPKRFMEFIKINFQISMTKLYNPDAFINKAHEERVAKYSSEISDLDV